MQSARRSASNSSTATTTTSPAELDKLVGATNPALHAANNALYRFMVAKIHRRFVERVDGFRAVGGVNCGCCAALAGPSDDTDWRG